MSTHCYSWVLLLHPHCSMSSLTSCGFDSGPEYKAKRQPGLTNPFHLCNIRSKAFQPPAYKSAWRHTPTLLITLKVPGVGPMMTQRVGTLRCERGCSKAGRSRGAGCPDVEAWLRILPPLVPFPHPLAGPWNLSLLHSCH